MTPRRARIPSLVGALHPRPLDWLNFLAAALQTSFGPFVVVYLTAHQWTQVSVGLALSVGTVTGMVSQIPAGALIDAIPVKRVAAGIAIVAIGLAALGLGLRPQPLPVLLAEILQGAAACMVMPAIAAMSLNRVGAGGAGVRLGRNASWAALGNGLASGVMGVIGYYISEQVVFLFAGALALPTLYALVRIGPPRRHVRAENTPVAASPARPLWRLFLDRRLLAFAGCAVLFQFANAPMLQLLGSALTRRDGMAASAIIGACLVVPQLVVAVFSPAVGRAAGRWGRRPVLILAFIALPLRGLLFTVVGNAALLLPVQALDGISGAAFGVLTPLIAADIARDSGRFNLWMGSFGLAGGIGASISTTLAGSVADHFGSNAAFLFLTAVGVALVLLAALALPETGRGSGEA
nr:DHA1 family drug:H(+) antiporter [uncultured Alphaproteobacteria bacterium]